MRGALVFAEPFCLTLGRCVRGGGGGGKSMEATGSPPAHALGSEMRAHTHTAWGQMRPAKLQQPQGGLWVPE